MDCSGNLVVILFSIRISTMGLGYQVYAAVAAGAAAVLPSSPPAAPHSGVQLGSLQFPTNFPNGDRLLLRDRDMEVIEEKQNRGPAQKIPIGCPEMFKEPILHCSPCGGESDTSPGKCKDPNGSGWICQCMLTASTIFAKACSCGTSS